MLGRVGRQHQRDLLVRVRDPSQTCVPHGNPCDPGGPARRRARSGEPSESISLNENGTVIRRPSNSGPRPGWRLEGRHAVVVGLPRLAAAGQHRPCRIGTSSAASSATVPRLVVAAGLRVGGFGGRRPRVTVTTIASARPSVSSRSPGAVRSEAQKIGSGFAPASSIARHSASMYAVFPAGAGRGSTAPRLSGRPPRGSRVREPPSSAGALRVRSRGREQHRVGQKLCS